MVKGQYKRIIGVIGIILVFMTGCAGPPKFLNQILGKNVAEQRKTLGDEWCPKITTFTVSPVTAQCGGQVSLELAAVSPNAQELSYSWDIEGQTFETGQRAVWKTPTARTIDDPEMAYTVRGVVSDGQCAVTRSVEVSVLCSSAFDVMVHFAFAKSFLDATAKTRLDEIGESLQQSPEYTVLIEGHTDYIGSDNSNKLLGKRRAEAVRNYLSKTWGIDPDRIITRSFGEEQPVKSNETSTGRAKNRRAEIFRVKLVTQQ